MNRIILHSDLNNFFASVECLLNPELKNKCIAVCGSKKDRHGIVLAKNQQAKEMGVITGETIGEAKRKCPMLLTVPPQFEKYEEYSKEVKNIYLRYTNQVEAFSIDECWLDVTGSTCLFGNGLKIAESIRGAVREETGLTVSVGVSFNKIFAKLASDMKKPDAVTEISIDSFREKAWNLPASCIMGVGKSTEKKLAEQGIYTIGDIANTPPEFLTRRLGKTGYMLWNYSNGLDNEPVRDSEYVRPIKSIGNGITCTANLTTMSEIKEVLIYLSQKVSHRLRKCRMKANGICVSVRDKDMHDTEFQAQLPYPTLGIRDISEFAFRLFREKYDWKKDVRALSVRAINLTEDSVSIQTSMFFDAVRIEKTMRAEEAIENIKNRFGDESVTFGSLVGNTKIPGRKK